MEVWFTPSHLLMLVCNWLTRENSVSYSLMVNALKSQVSLGVWRDRMWPDGWTIVTADGKRSAQFEHTLLVGFYSITYSLNVVVIAFIITRA